MTGCWFRPAVPLRQSRGRAQHLGFPGIAAWGRGLFSRRATGPCGKPVERLWSLSQVLHRNLPGVPVWRLSPAHGRRNMMLPVSACRRDTSQVRKPLRGTPGRPERTPRGSGRGQGSESRNGGGAARRSHRIGGAGKRTGSSEPLPSVEVRCRFGGEAGNRYRSRALSGRRIGGRLSSDGRLPGRVPAGKVASPLAATVPGGAGRLRPVPQGRGCFGRPCPGAEVPARIQALAGQEFGYDRLKGSRLPSGAVAGRQVTVVRPEPLVSCPFGDTGCCDVTIAACRGEAGWRRIGQGCVPPASRDETGAAYRQTV